MKNNMGNQLIVIATVAKQVMFNIMPNVHGRNFVILLKT